MATVHERRYVAPDEEVIVTPSVETTVAEEHVVERVPDAEFHPFRVLRTFIAFAGLVVSSLLGIRFLLLLVGADPNAGFADFIYGITGPMAAPFEGIAGDPDIDSGGTFDMATVIASIVYFVATALAMLFVSTIASAVPHRQETVTRSTLVHRS